MKILNIIGELSYGGAELQTIELGKRFVSNGNSVMLLIIGDCVKSVSDEATNAGIELRFLDSNSLSLINIVKISKIIRQYKFDIIHAHLFPALYLIALCSLWSDNKAKFIYTEHSTSNRRRRYKFLKLIEQPIYSAFHRIVCVSRDVESELNNWLPKIKNTVIIPNGIDLDRFYYSKAESRTKIGLSKTDIIILMAGSFRYEKNQSILIHTLLHLPINYKLLLAGNGPMLEKVKSLAQKINVKDRVLFLGEVHNIERVMKMADVYVLPSIYEGFGLSAVEAAACGLPVVYSNVPGLNSVFESYGIPVDVDKPENIAKGILKVINTTKNIEVIRLASKRFTKQFDINETFEKYKNIYTQT